MELFYNYTLWFNPDEDEGPLGMFPHYLIKDK